jgi:hypothetical protein
MIAPAGRWMRSFARSRNFARSAYDHEHGFTLVELLVATASGAVLMLALFAMLDFSTTQSARIAGKVDSDQQGRTAMEKIMLELHSSCLVATIPPVQAGSEATSIQFISATGSNASFPTAYLHNIHLTKGELIDDSYANNNPETAPPWTFPALGKPNHSQNLLTKVSQSQIGSPAVTVPVFQYFRYYTSEDKGGTPGEIDTTPLTTPLSTKDAQATAEVTVSFTANPLSGKAESDRSTDFSDSAQLRFDPSSGNPSTTNTACA